MDNEKKFISEEYNKIVKSVSINQINLKQLNVKGFNYENVNTELGVSFKFDNDEYDIN